MNNRKLLLSLTIAFSTLPFFAKDYSVLDFGAIGDGKTDDATAIQRAIDTCSAEGGGSVIFPLGKHS